MTLPQGSKNESSRFGLEKVRNVQLHDELVTVRALPARSPMGFFFNVTPSAETVTFVQNDGRKLSQSARATAKGGMQCSTAICRSMSPLTAVSGW